MKLLTLAALFAFVMPAHAFYVSLSCSNATGTVIWEEGENINLVRLTYDGFVTGVLDVERAHLNVQFQEQIQLRQQMLAQCGSQSTLTTFASRVLITPAEGHPDALQSYFPDNQIVTDVICERIESVQSHCHP